MLERQICGHFKDGVIKSCDEVCGRNMGEIFVGGMKR